MRVTPIAAVIAVFAATSALAGIDIGPAIGSHAPALAPTVTDSAGKAATLASIAGPKGTVLVFFRSVKWCPFCQHQMIELKAAAAPLAARGYTLAAISYDAPETQATFAAKQGVGFTFLADPGSKTIDAWNLRDPQYTPDSFAYGVPRPAIFVLDAKGVVRAKLAEDGYRVRPPVDAVIAAVDGVK
jgi:peroxiredoxin